MGEAVRWCFNNSQNDRWLTIHDNHHTPKLLGCIGSSQLSLEPLVAVKKLLRTEHSLEIRAGWELDGLPLALAIASAYLRQVSTSFADYLQLYKQSWLRLQRNTPVRGSSAVLNE
ncbi:hypothetical protein K505DRAFT_344375 [Melanomma pulvis-pyrius CBS 109.77]|uniref:Uncharacterized protein n=1 Tax=Melanomma pulvis-pyrius CBS 109.77 TaxID=1314802 RepID=A0A6A6WPF2_9PLEO|nr:hypothetical protein K505DRAFT_344375 [Melanomma pulvis-pyrius CBS 109.77]